MDDEDKLNIIINMLKKIQNSIDLIVEDNNSIKTNTTKMSTHIDFINEVYYQMKQPLNYLSSYFSSKQPSLLTLKK